MRFLISIITAIVLIPSLCLAGPGIPESEQFIMKDPAGFIDIRVSIDGSWTPTREDTRKALEAISDFLNDPDSHEETIRYWTTDMERAKEEIEKIRTNFSKYGVQFGGFIHDGKKLIHCNFGPADRVDRDFQGVDDGGFWFWQIDYDMETGKLINLYINGYA